MYRMLTDSNKNTADIKRSHELWNDLPQERIDEFLREDPKMYGVDHPLRVALRSLIDPSDSFLEVGCGNGVELDSLRMAHPNIKYTGVDVTPRLIEVAQKLHPNDDFRVGDIFNLDFPENSYDSVICRAVLEHLPGYIRPIHELFRVSRKMVYLVFFDISDGNTIFRLDSEGFLYHSYNYQEIIRYLKHFSELFSVHIIRNQYNKKYQAIFQCFKKEGPIPTLNFPPGKDVHFNVPPAGKHLVLGASRASLENLAGKASFIALGEDRIPGVESYAWIGGQIPYPKGYFDEVLVVGNVEVEQTQLLRVAKKITRL